MIKYRVSKRYMNLGKHEGKTVYNAKAVSYGTLDTDDAAKQISEESSLTTADVRAVLDRYAYFVRKSLCQGYSVNMLGFGTLFAKLVTGDSVEDETQVDASIIKSVVPAFRPSYTKMSNGTRDYDLIPSDVSVVKMESGKRNADKDTAARNGSDEP